MIFGQISSAMSSLINSHHLSRSTLERQECLALQKSCSKTHSLICKWSWFFFVKLYYPPLAFMALSYVHMYVEHIHMHGGAFWPSNRPLGKEQPWRDKRQSRNSYANEHQTSLLRIFFVSTHSWLILSKLKHSLRNQFIIIMKLVQSKNLKVYE